MKEFFDELKDVIADRNIEKIRNDSVIKQIDFLKLQLKKIEAGLEKMIEEAKKVQRDGPPNEWRALRLLITEKANIRRMIKAKLSELFSRLSVKGDDSEDSVEKITKAHNKQN